jgi:hypothetical protein
MVSSCHNNNCKTEFTFLIRKHHCRYCGNIYCHNCTSKKIVIPDYIKDKPNNSSFTNYINSLIDTKRSIQCDYEEKVCDECFDIIKNKIHLKDLINAMLDNPPDIIDLKNEQYDLTRMHYLDYLRNIQYYLPNHKYNSIDKNILDQNNIYFSEHSKYLTHLIKSIEWDQIEFNIDVNIDSNTYIMNILNASQKLTCKDLYCTRTCKSNLQLTDCINILFSSYDQLPDNILIYLFDIISHNETNEIYCYLSIFVSIIKQSIINKLLPQLIYKLIKSSAMLLNSIYWLLAIEKESNSNLPVEINNINRFINIFDENTLIRIKTNYAFFQGISNNFNDVRKYLVNNFDIFKPVYLPFDPNVLITKIDYNTITIKESSTRPVIITFETNTNKKIRIMFKNENVMNDHIVLNLINLTNTVLHNEINSNYQMILYHVLPITTNSGLIEIIENAETIHSINLSGQCILQYIMQNNEDKLIQDVLDRYTYSLVCYTLHSYFLGVRDRHLENIMITTDGRIFHIDFGFILGRDPHPISSSDIKINSGMLDVIYGVKSSRYIQYKQLCSQAVILIRKQFSDYFMLLSQLQLDNIENFIYNRFQLRQSDEKIKEELNELIERSQGVYMENVRDFLHFHTKEKTVQTGLNNILSYGYDLFSQSLKQ